MGANDDPLAASMPSDRPRLRRSTLAVLFVDPDVASAQRLASTIKGQSAVAVVPTAQAALSAIGLRVPSLVVTELDLPDGSGLALLSRIHSAPLTRHVLLMVLTRRTAVRDKIAAFQAGADDYLVKPVDPQQFAEHMRVVIRFRQVIGD